MGVNQAGLRLRGDIAYWEVQGLEITNTDGTDGEQGDIFGVLVYIDGPDQSIYRHIYIHDCYIHDVYGAVPDKGRGGIHVMLDDGLDTSRIDDLRIAGNRIEDVEPTDWFPVVSGSQIRLQTIDSTANPSIWEFEVFPAEAEIFMELEDDALVVEWQGVPGVGYSLQSSTNLLADHFSTTIESGIPSLQESSQIVIEMPDADAAFYRVIAE